MKRKELIAFIALLLIALLPNIAIVCWAADVADAGQKMLYLLASLVLYAIGFCFLHKRAYFYTISLGFFFSTFELAHLLARGKSITMLYLYTWFKTPPSVRWAPLVDYWWVSMVVLGVWVLYYVTAHYCIERRYIAPLRWRLPALAVLVSVYILLPVRACPMNVLYQFGRLASFALKVERNLPELREDSFGAQPRKSKAQETVIVVLGETSYDQWQALGYSDSLAIDFDSVYAECPVSGVSVPLSLSRATPTDKEPFFVEKSVIKAFNEAEYHSAWLSNYGYRDHFLMRIADDCRYMTYLPYQADTVLLPAFREAMRYPSQRHLVVMATQGGKDSVGFASTPYLLRQLTDSLRRTHQPAMLVYAGATNIHLNDDYSSLRVPLMIWTNPNYRYRHRPAIRCLLRQRSQRVSMSALFHTLLYMNDIYTPVLDESKALGSSSFLPNDTIWYLDENLQARSFLP